MKIQKLHKRRSTIIEKKDELKIAIPVKKIYILIIVYTAVAIIFTGFILGFRETHLKNGISVFDLPLNNLLILAFLVVAYIAILLSILALIFRKEIIVISKDELKIRKQFTFQRTRKYNPSGIEYFHIKESLKYKMLIGFGKNSNQQRANWIWTIVVCEVFNFIYQNKKVKFGMGIDEAEAKYIMQLLVDKGYININQTIANIGIKDHQ